MKYHILSLGCQMNQSDTERVRTVLQGMGFSPTENEDEAHVLGVIACSVRQKAIDKVYSRIAKWNKMKNRKSLITFVSGCILPSDRERFLKLFDLVFPMGELPDLPQMISQYGIVTPAGLQQLDSGHDSLMKNNGKKEKDTVLKPATMPGQKTTGLKLNPAADIDHFWQVEPSYTS
jgi:tRNA-2-methylthio-N6-dimethylallyladenosine synthase